MSARGCFRFGRNPAHPHTHICKSRHKNLFSSHVSLRTNWNFSRYLKHISMRRKKNCVISTNSMIRWDNWMWVVHVRRNLWAFFLPSPCIAADGKISINAKSNWTKSPGEIIFFILFVRWEKKHVTEWNSILLSIFSIQKIFHFYGKIQLNSFEGVWLIIFINLLFFFGYNTLTIFENWSFLQSNYFLIKCLLQLNFENLSQLNFGYLRELFSRMLQIFIWNNMKFSAFYISKAHKVCR